MNSQKQNTQDFTWLESIIDHLSVGRRLARGHSREFLGHLIEMAILETSAIKKEVSLGVEHKRN